MPGKILIVDDHAPNRELIREALTDSAYEISEAGTASEALERLQRHKTDLVITDVRMPGLSGVELLKRLNKEYPDIVVISSMTLEDSDCAVIVETLEQANWVVGGPRGAAAKLGLKRTTLLAKMRRLGISRPIEQDGTDTFGVAQDAQM